MLLAMILGILHTFGAELARVMMRAPGAVTRWRVQYGVPMGLLSILALLRSEYGWTSPVWLVALLAILSLLVTAWFASQRMYWLLTALLALVSFVLAFTVLAYAEPLLLIGLAAGSQLALAVLARQAFSKRSSA